MPRIYIISGGPGTGKTSIITELSKKYKVIPEAARELGENDPRFMGKSVKETNQQEFQDAIFELQRKQLENISSEKIIFLDRGFEDTIAYCGVRKLKIPKWVKNYLKNIKYSGVFILDFLDSYVRDTLRQESKKEQEKIHREIIKCYKDKGYLPVFVPMASICDRVKFILSKIKK